MIFRGGMDREREPDPRSFPSRALPPFRGKKFLVEEVEEGHRTEGFKSSLLPVKGHLPRSSHARDRQSPFRNLAHRRGWLERPKAEDRSWLRRILPRATVRFRTPPIREGTRDRPVPRTPREYTPQGNLIPSHLSRPHRRSRR